MVAKVEALLEKYRVKKPEEMTQEEYAAYQNQQNEAQTAYKNKIEDIQKEIKDYASNYKDDPNLTKEENDKARNKYTKLSDGQRYSLAAKIYQQRFGIKFQLFIDEHPNLNNQPELKGWAQFTFEEILQMESDGVNIPKEVLDWAHSMQDSDATDYVAEDLESLSFDATDSEMTQLQKKTIALNKKAQEKEEEITEKETRLRELAEEAETIKRDQENGTKDSLKQIQDLTGEWNELSKKSKKGGLSEAETARMKELGTLLNGEDGKLTVEIQASNADMQDLMNLMEGLSIDIEQGIDIGQDTIQIAKELSAEESFYHPKTVSTDIDVNINSVQDSVLDAKGQNLSINALEQGNKLVEFSNTLNNQIMMGQYQALYDFAKTFTTKSDEALDGTKEAMGESFNKSSEDFENGDAITGNAEDEASTDGYDTSSLRAFGEKGQSILEKIELLKTESERVEEEALEEVEAYKTEQEKVGKKVQQVQEEKLQKAQTAVAAGDTNTAQTSEEEAVSAGEDAAEETNATQEPTENINKDIEATNKKELTIQEKLKADIDLNNDYAKLNKEARTLMQMQIAMGTFASEMGIAGIVGGSILISNGAALIATVIMAPEGAILVAIGTELLILGTEYLGLGIAMGVTGGQGIKASTETGDQIVETDETINTSLQEVNKIDGIENEEDTRSQAEKEKDIMDKKGLSELEQAAYFGGKSVEYSALTEGSIINIRNAAVETLIERIKSGMVSDRTVKETEKDNESIEKLEQRKLEAQRVKEEEEQKVRDFINNLAQKAQEGDEIALEMLRGVADDPAKITDAIKKKVDAIFSAADQAKIDQLKEEIVARGEKAQNITDQSFEKVQQIKAELDPKEEESVLAEDYGTMSVSSGAELLKMYGMIAWNPIAAVMFAAALVTGMFAVTSGGISQLQGKRNLAEFAKADKFVDESMESITQDQSDVEQATGVAGVSAAAQSEGEAEDAAASEGGDSTEGDESAEGTAETSGEDGTAETIGEEGVDENIEGEINGEEGISIENGEAIVNPEEMIEGDSLENLGIDLPKEMSLEEFIESKLVETEEVLEAQEAEEAKETGKNKDGEETKEADNGDMDASDGKNAAAQGKEKQKEVDNLNKDVNRAGRDSERLTKDSEKTEKQLEAESKAVLKEIEKEQKKIEKLTKESAAALQEQLILGAEYDALSAQNDAVGAVIQSKQEKAANAPAPKKAPGLLGGGGTGAPNVQQEIVVVMSNQGRMDQIAGRFTQLDTKITRNRTAMIKGQATVKTRIKKFEKIAKEKAKLQKEQQKIEQAKQKKLQQQMATIGIVNNVFSIIGTIGTILTATGKILILTAQSYLAIPFGLGIPAYIAQVMAGLALINIGSAIITPISVAGILSCAVANAAITLSQGFNIGAIIQLGMAVVQAVMACVGASQAGAALGSVAGNAITIASSTLNLVATSMDMANNVKVAQGKEADQDLALASQIIGMTSALVGAGAGFSGGGKGGGGGFGSMGGAQKAGTLLSFFGSAVSTAGQISASIKEKQGKNSGVLESALSFVGGILSSAGGISSGAKGEDGSVNKQALAGSIMQGAGSIISGSAGLSASTKKDKNKPSKTETLLQSAGSAISAAGAFTKAVPGKDGNGNKIEMNASQKTELSAAVLQLTGSVVSTAGAITKAFQSSEHHDGDYIMMAGNAISFAGQSLSTINGIAQGLKNGVDMNGNSYFASDAAGTILSLMGQAATMSAQMSANIKQINGKNAGEVEEYLALAGAGLSTVGNATTTFGKIAHEGKKSPKQVEVEINDAVKGLPEGEQAKAREHLQNLPPKERDEKLSKLQEVSKQEKAIEADPTKFLEDHNKAEQEKAAKNPAYTADIWKNKDDAKAKLAEQRKNILAHETAPKPAPDDTPAPGSTPAPAPGKPANQKSKLTPEERAKIRADKKEERKNAREERKIARQERYEEFKLTFKVAHDMMKAVRPMKKDLDNFIKSNGTDTETQQKLEQQTAKFNETFKDYIPDSAIEKSKATTQEVMNTYSEKSKNGKTTLGDVIKDKQKEMRNNPEQVKETTETWLKQINEGIKNNAKLIVDEKIKAAAASGNTAITGGTTNSNITGQNGQPAGAQTPVIGATPAPVEAGNQPAAPKPPSQPANTGDKPEQGGETTTPKEENKTEDKDGKQEAKKIADAKKREQREKVAKGLAIAKAAMQEASNTAKVAFQIVEQIEMNKQQDTQHQRQAAEVNLAALERSRALTRTITRKHAAERRHSHYNRKA